MQPLSFDEWLRVPSASSVIPSFSTPTRRVAAIDDDLRTLVADMFDTMAAAHGVGLAANQVGVDLRVFVYDCPDE